MADLADQNCVPCRGGTPPLEPAEQAHLLRQLESEWNILEGRRLERAFAFPDFVSGLDFVNRIGALAEAQRHHPDLLLRWGEVRVSIWTHAIDGLSPSDFVLAAKIDRLHRRP